MADAITIKALQDASLDAKSLEEVVNGDEAKQITTRKGETYPSVKKAIKTLFENGGLPATPFATKALMTASALVNGDYAQVTDDTANNGLYVKTAGAWVKSAYEPLQAGDYAAIQNSLVKALDVDFKNTVISTKKAGVDFAITNDFYLDFSGNPVAQSLWSYSSFIDVLGFDAVTISQASTYVGIFYNELQQVVSAIPSASVSVTTNYTFSIPKGVRYIKVNVRSADSVKSLELQKITPEYKPLSVRSAVADILSAEPLKIGVNLLDGNTKEVGYYLTNAGARVAQALYGYTELIPVTPNTNYMISRASTHVGRFFDSTKTLISIIPSAGITPVSDYAFTTPSNAAYVQVNFRVDFPSQFLYNTSETPTVNHPYKLVIPNDGGVSSRYLGNQWAGKTIAWYGTSIPAGTPHENDRDKYSYANLSVKDLGGRVINKAVPNSGVGSTIPGSFVLLSSAINYQNSLVDIIGTAQNPDLVVFDFGVNDHRLHPSDLNAFDINDPYDTALTGKPKVDSRITSEFIGAYNTIIDAMLTKDPTIKFCFICHFSNDRPDIPRNYKKLFEAQKALAEYWDVPIFETYKYTNFKKRNGFDGLTPYIPDGIHPAGGDGRALETLRVLMRNFLLSIA